MLWSLRDFAPATLVPAAWLATAAAHVGALDAAGILIAHVVMAAFIAFFAVTGWSAMATGALRAWRLVLVVGFVFTLAGIAGFLGAPGEALLLATSLVGWMLLPAAGLVYTGLAMPDRGVVYHAGGVLSALGAVVYVGWLATGGGDELALVALALVGIGQGGGIVAATVRE